MNDEQAVLARHFAGIGASERFQEWERPSGRRAYDVDVTRRKKGGRQAFVISTVRKAPVEFHVPNRDPASRHLLLVVRVGDTLHPERMEKHRFLCGHDEREWFPSPTTRRWRCPHGIASYPTRRTVRHGCSTSRSWIDLRGWPLATALRRAGSCRAS